MLRVAHCSSSAACCMLHVARCALRVARCAARRAHPPWRATGPGSAWRPSRCCPGARRACSSTADNRQCNVRADDTQATRCNARRATGRDARATECASIAAALAAAPRNMPSSSQHGARALRRSADDATEPVPVPMWGYESRPDAAAKVWARMRARLCRMVQAGRHVSLCHSVSDPDLPRARSLSSMEQTPAQRGHTARNVRRAMHHMPHIPGSTQRATRRVRRGAPGSRPQAVALRMVCA